MEKEKETLDKQIWTRVSSAQHEQFKSKAKADGSCASAALRVLISKYLKGEVTL